MANRHDVEGNKQRWTRRDFFRAGGALAVGGLTLSAFPRPSGGAPVRIASSAENAAAAAGGSPSSAAIAHGKLDAIVADPTAVPPPISRKTPAHHDVTLNVEEVVAEIEPGKSFRYMTFGGQVPGPMIRVRQGDTVRLTLRSSKTNHWTHNVDMHAVYGTGGGNEATTVQPGQSNGMLFQARYPGAFIYHCAVPNLDFHISSGMFGMIVVEPPEGLPKVDHEFYLGQNEVYTQGSGKELQFDFDRLIAEDPTYVLLQGAKHALTPDRAGPIKARVGETARIFFVCGGPNLTSHFHPIGNVWTKAWPAGALASEPMRYVQTLAVPPGSCGVLEMEFPVPETIKLVDHAITRVVHKGMLGQIEVEGKPRPDIFRPHLPGDPGRAGSDGVS